MITVKLPSPPPKCGRCGRWVCVVSPKVGGESGRKGAREHKEKVCEVMRKKRAEEGVRLLSG